MKKSRELKQGEITSMSFTPDELQAFNDILEKKLSVHRREMERVFEQRLQILRRELEQRLYTAQQELLHYVTQTLGEQQRGLQAVLKEKLNAQHVTIAQSVGQEVRLRQQQQQPQLASLVDRALAAQLLAIEELLNQRLAPQSGGDDVLPMSELAPQFEAIEVQTELAWEDLLDIFGKALDERFANLHEFTQVALRNIEHYFAAQLQTIQSQLQDSTLHDRQASVSSGNLANMQEVFQGIERLERIIESMQVAMTANHSLLSNRLYHHQQMPGERAHGTASMSSVQQSHSEGTNERSS